MYYKHGSLEISGGNTKVGDDTLILNMCSATDCPSSKLGLCKLGEKCYALKAEKRYLGCLPYRRRQADYWKNTGAPQIAADILAVVKRIKRRITFVRLSEAGDFETQEDVDKASLLAVLLKKHGIITYTYSARSDLDFSKCAALLVKGSGHNGGNNGKTIARPRKSIPDVGGLYHENMETFLVCKENCRKCTFCKTDKGFNIVFPIH